MGNWASSSPTVNNCTFSGNTANDYGGGMYIYNNSSPTVTDSYFCFNVPDAIGGEPLHPNSGGNNMEFCPPPQPIEPFGDSDGDGDVDMIDLAAFAANWLEGT